MTACEGHLEGTSWGLEESSKRHQHRVWAHPEPVLGLLAKLSHQCWMRGGEEMESGQDFCTQDAPLCNEGTLVKGGALLSWDEHPPCPSSSPAFVICIHLP